MPKAMSVTDAQANFGELLDYVAVHEDGIIVERQGEPAAIVLSIASYEEAQEGREQQRRNAALARLRAIQARASDRNHDLTEEEAVALADQLSHELVEDMAIRGEIKFERDRVAP